MTDTRTTLKDAHGALMALWIASGESGSGVSLILHGLRTLIASLEAAEPVAYVTAYGVIVEHGLPLEPGQQLYAHPVLPVEQRKPLTDGEIQEIFWQLYEHVFFPGDGQRNLLVARAIEAAHGIGGKV